MAAQNQAVPRAEEPGPAIRRVRHLATIRSTVRKHAAGQMASSHRDSPVTSYGVLPPRRAAAAPFVCCRKEEENRRGREGGKGEAGKEKAGGLIVFVSEVVAWADQGRNRGGREIPGPQQQDKTRRSRRRGKN